MRSTRGTLTEPGSNSPFRERPVAENLDLFRRMRAGEFPNRRAGAARQDRHGLGQHQSARSGALSHPPCRASAHRHGVVHLSELRLRSRPVGRDRRHHAFAVHARIRGSPPALRLVFGQSSGPVAPASIRVRAAQSDPHHPVEARAHRARCAAAMCAAGTIRACRRLPDCAAAACRPPPSANSCGGSASPRQTAWWMPPCWILRSAKNSTRPRSGAWPCCGRSRS